MLPGEARVWRSAGLGPHEARECLPHTAPPLPPGVRANWTAMGNHTRAARRYAVTDPPGTRGRTAGRRTPRDEPPV